MDEVPCPVRWQAGRFVSAGRYYRIATGGRLPASSPDTVLYTLLDLKERKVFEISTSLTAFRAKYGAKFGRSVGNLMHYDGRVSSMLFSELGAGYKTVAQYFCQYDHVTGVMSEPLKLADLDDLHTFIELKPDPLGASFYYIVYARDPLRPKAGFHALDVARVSLRSRTIDWRMRLELPKRVQLLSADTNFFSPDGTKLAFIEHNEKLYEKNVPAIPRQQGYIIEIESKAVSTIPVPLSPYGSGFSRDGRYLLFGSNELGEIWRVNLASRKVEQKVQGPRLIHKFVMAPSGSSFFVVHDTEKIPPKVVHVYGVEDLLVKASIPEARFPSELGSPDGRFLLKFLEGKIEFYQVPDDIDSGSVTGPSAALLELTTRIGVGRSYLLAHHLDFYDADSRIGNPAESFAPIIALADGGALVAGTFDDTVGNEYIVGATHPTIARVGPDGNALWSRDLKKSSFPDSRAGAVAGLRDGSCIAYIASFPHHQRSPIVRLVRLDSFGKTVWDMNFRGDGGFNTPICERLQLNADESVSITGYVIVSKGVRKPWTAVVDASGRILSDTMGK